MKKIYLILLMCLSLFLVGVKVYAEEEFDTQYDYVTEEPTEEIKEYNLESYKIDIKINDDNTVTVEEKIKTGDLGEETVFVKEFYNTIAFIDSDFFELPNNEHEINAYYYNSKSYDFNFESNKEYHLKYTIDISDFFDYLDFRYTPMISKNGSTNYNDISFKINYNDTNKITVDDLVKKSYLYEFNVNSDKNVIEGSYKNFIGNNGDESPRYIEINFEAMNNNAISVFGMMTLPIFIVISAIFFASVIIMSIYRIKSNDYKYNRPLIVLLIIYVIETMITLSLHSSSIVTSIISYTVLSAFYGIFYKSIFFPKLDDATNRKSFLIAELFVLFHSYLFFTLPIGAAGSHFRFLLINIYIIMLMIAIVVASIAYKHNKTLKQSKKDSYTPQEMMNLYKCDTYSLEKKTFEEYKKKYSYDNTSNLFKKILVIYPLSIFVVIVIEGMVLALASDIIEKYVDLGFLFTFILVLSLLIFTYFFVGIPIIKYYYRKTLIYKGDIYTDIPFEYINVKENYDSGIISYKIKALFNYGGKDSFISDFKSGTYIYDSTTCSVIVLKDNPDIYYVDFDIPKR